jgi:hypothetical protein
MPLGYKAPEENRKKYEPKVWRKKAFQGVSLILLCSNALQIRIVRRRKQLIKPLYKVHIGATAETEIRKQQHEQEKKWKSTGRKP